MEQIIKLKRLYYSKNAPNQKTSGEVPGVLLFVAAYMAFYVYEMIKGGA